MIKTKKVYLLLIFLLMLSGCGFKNADIRFVSELEETAEQEQGNNGQSEQLAESEEDGLVEQSELESITTIPSADMTDEVNRYYYTQMDEEEKLLYGQLLSGIQLRQDQFYVNAKGKEQIHATLGAVLADYPEIFWIDGKSTLREIKTAEIFEFELTYNLEKDRIDQVQQQIETAAQAYLDHAVNAPSKYEQVKLAYDFIINQTEYQLDSVQNQNIQSVLVNQTSVCAGYARAFQYLMRKLDIPCIYIEGNAGATQQLHAWNQVYMDGNWYLLDCTWGEPNYLETSDSGHESVIYDYFCITTEEMNRSHTPNSAYTLPIGTDHSKDYYVQIDSEYNSYSSDELVAAVWNTVNESGDRTYFKYLDEASYLQAKADVENQEILADPIQQKMEWDNLQNYEYGYSYNDNLYILKLYW